MEFSKAKWSWYWLARNKPYWLVLLSGLMLAGSFPPSPLNYLIYIAFVPVFLLVEVGIVPERQPEDTVFLPFKRFLLVAWRILMLQWIWRRSTRGLKVFRYVRRTISGHAQIFRYTYSMFFIWNLLFCYWLTFPALGARSFQEALVSVTVGILAIFLNPLLMAIPLQLHSRIRHYFPNALSAFFLVIFWLTFEYLHFNWELAWPWLTLGNALSYHPEMVQYAEYTGVLGVSLQILLVNFLVYTAYRNLRGRRWLAVAAGFLAIATFAFPYWIGSKLTESDREVFESCGTLRVRIVQPDIDPFSDRMELSAAAMVDRYTNQILSMPLDSGTLVMLPERAIPQALDPRMILKGRTMTPLWELVDTCGVEILTGLEDMENYPDSVPHPISARERYRMVAGKLKHSYVDYYNSALIMHPERTTLAYRKGHLVPMVERVPFLRGLKALKFLHIDPAKGLLSFGRPDSLITLQTYSEIPTNVVICYESAFGDHTRRKTLLGAKWIAMITNDGWWSKSSGYVQHAGLCVLRAIENRRAVARCANNGRSMFVDAKGQITQATPYGEAALIEAEVPLYDHITFYVRYGDFIGWIAGILTILIILFGIALHLRQRQKSNVRHQAS